MSDSNSSILALDVGERRIGYALANVVAALPRPGGVILAGPKAQEQIKELVQEHQAVSLVVGLPRNLQGEDTQQTIAVRAFATELQNTLAIPIHWQDEALTSHKAEEELNNRGVQYNKEAVDALAAAYILADFLSEHPHTV